MTRTIRFLFWETLILFARLTERLRKPRVAVFVYHSIDESGTAISLSPQFFEQQLNYLRSHKYHLLCAGQAIEAYQNKQLTHKCVVLTFDDAYTSIASWIENLLAHGETATVFVATAVIGHSNLWDMARKDIDQMDIMTSKHLQKLSTEGCEIGGHTHTHPNLTESSPDELKWELSEGCTAFTQQINIPSNIIAYPYGAYNDLVKAETKQAGYVAGFTTQVGYLTDQSDLLEIPRFPTNIDFQLFRMIVHGGYGWYRKLQDWLFS